MTTSKPYFILYAHNQVVEGEKRAAIYDLKQARVFYIPKVLVGILEELRERTLSEVIELYAADQPEALLQYIDFLQDYDLGFYVDDPQKFPQLSLCYYYPGTIQNAIVLSDLRSYDLGAALHGLAEQGCRFLNLFIDLQATLDFEKLWQGLEQVADSIFVSIQLAIRGAEAVPQASLKALYLQYKKLSKITICEADERSSVQPGLIHYSEKNLADLLAPTSDQLILNIPFFSEAIRFNPYYYQKVVIGWKGEIKNGVNTRKEFGYIQYDSLERITTSTDFQALWEVNADRITELQNSELRYAQFLNQALDVDAKEALQIIKPVLS